MTADAKPVRWIESRGGTVGCDHYDCPCTWPWEAITRIPDETALGFYVYLCDEHAAGEPGEREEGTGR